MRQRFGSSRHAMKWLNQWEVRQRKPGESITALGDELRQLAKKAYRNLDSIAQDTLALNQLYKLIPVEMKCRCVDHDCQSVQQAVEVIERYEAILGEDRLGDRKKNNLRSLDHKTEPQNTDPTVTGILKKLDARLEKLESLSLSQQIAGRENTSNKRPGNKNNRCCFLCSSPDHMVRNCPERNRQGPKQRYQGPPNGPFQGNRATQNGALQAPQQAAPPQFPVQHFTQQQRPIQPPQFSFPPPIAPEKRPTVDSVGHESTVESGKWPANNFPDDRMRTGHIGETTLKGDNGFYTRWFIFDKPLDFLIDNGSTGSILSSRKYNELKTDLESFVRPFNTTVYDASGNAIPTHGAVEVKISLGGCDFGHILIICDIQQDGVIGQDLLLIYAENISYKHGRINTRINEINCWLGDASSDACRVVVRKTTIIPSLIASWLSIDIPGAENLTRFGYVEANVKPNEDLANIPGVLDLQKAEK